MISPDQLADLASRGESETQEHKLSTGQRSEAAKSICALLNHRGGRVVIGVTPEGQIRGQHVTEKTIDDLVQELRAIDPPVFPSIERVLVAKGMEVLVVTVEIGPRRPYSYRGKAYRRVGTTNQPLSGDDYNHMLLEQLHSTRRWESEVAQGWSVEDLDRTEIVRTLEEAIRRGRAEEPGSRKPLDILRGFGLVRGELVLRAAVVLFARPDRLLPDYPQCLLRVARFVGVDKSSFRDNRQFNGNAFDLVARAERFCMDHLPIAGRIIPGIFERVDDPLYPPAALREAIANAICHRDYSLGGGAIHLAIYDDRLEIQSSGSLHFGLKAEDLYKPHLSLPWNPLIASVFYRRGIIEAWGRGTLKMRELADQAGLPRPEISEIAGAVCVCFRPNGNRKLHQLTDRQQQVLRALGSSQALSLRALHEVLEGSVSLRLLRRDLGTLREAGLVGLTGRGKGALWSLSR